MIQLYGKLRSLILDPIGDDKDLHSSEDRLLTSIITAFSTLLFFFLLKLIYDFSFQARSEALAPTIIISVSLIVYSVIQIISRTKYRKYSAPLFLSLFSLGVLSVIHPDEIEAIKKRSELLAAGKAENYAEENRVINKITGKTHHIVTRVQKINSDSKNSKYIGTIEDITGIIRSNYVELQVAKLASVGELASGVAHEINNPLAILLGKSQLLNRRLKDLGVDGDEKLKSHLASVEIEVIHSPRKFFSALTPVDYNRY